MSAPKTYEILALTSGRLQVIMKTGGGGFWITVSREYTSPEDAHAEIDKRIAFDAALQNSLNGAGGSSTDVPLT